MVANEEGIIKMVDSSTCEVIGTVTVNVTGRDRTMRTLEAFQYFSEIQYNLISLWMLNSEGCQVQVQLVVVTVSEEDRVILKGEKC